MPPSLDGYRLSWGRVRHDADATQTSVGLTGPDDLAGDSLHMVRGGRGRVVDSVDVTT